MSRERKKKGDFYHSGRRGAPSDPSGRERASCTQEVGEKERNRKKIQENTGAGIGSTGLPGLVDRAVRYKIGHVTK